MYNFLINLVKSRSVVLVISPKMQYMMKVKNTERMNEKEDNNFSVNFEVNGKKYIVVTASEGTQGIFRNRVVERVKKPGFLTKQIAVDLPIILYLNQFFTKQ